MLQAQQACAAAYAAAVQGGHGSIPNASSAGTHPSAAAAQAHAGAQPGEALGGGGEGGGSGFAAALAALPPQVAAQLRMQLAANPAGFQAMLAAGRGGGRASGDAAAGKPAEGPGVGGGSLHGLPPVAGIPVVLHEAHNSRDGAHPRLRPPGAAPLPKRSAAADERAAAGGGLNPSKNPTPGAPKQETSPRAAWAGVPGAQAPRRPRPRAEGAAAAAEVAAIVRSSGAARGRGGRSRGRGCTPLPSVWHTFKRSLCLTVPSDGCAPPWASRTGDVYPRWGCARSSPDVQNRLWPGSPAESGSAELTAPAACTRARQSIREATVPSHPASRCQACEIDEGFTFQPQELLVC